MGNGPPGRRSDALGNPAAWPGGSRFGRLARHARAQPGGIWRASGTGRIAAWNQRPSRSELFVPWKIEIMLSYPGSLCGQRAIPAYPVDTYS